VNAIEQAHYAYARQHNAVRTARATEAQLLSQVTARMRMAVSGESRNFPALVAALHDNRRIWTTLAASVADRDNQLPDPLRAQLFFLAEFVETHSNRVLQGEATVDVLLDINIAIMRGLNGQGGQPCPV
jgi:flagellar protein FlaF